MFIFTQAALFLIDQTENCPNVHVIRMDEYTVMYLHKMYYRTPPMNKLQLHCGNYV
jgi:hypothetical protein